MTGQWIEEGDPNSPLYIVGEAPGEREVAQRRPFVGPSGQLLDSCLREAGLYRRDCFLTNICHVRPPTYRDKHNRRIDNDIDQFFATATQAKREGIPLHLSRYPREPITAGLARLQTLIGQHRPRLIIAMGNTGLWGLVGETGITKWRGSTFLGKTGTRTIATFHPADCLANRSPHHRPILVHDLTRARRELDHPSEPPQWRFVVAPLRQDVRDWLGVLAEGQPLTCDIETRNGQVACLGLASSPETALCIPFMRAQPGDNGHSYWSLDDECHIVALLQQILSTHPTTWHNGLFDCQYLARQWAFGPCYHDDTMVMQHVAFPGLLGGKIDPVSGRTDKRGSSLSLSFIASLYCRHYRHWKDDGRLFDPSQHDEGQLWSYNCEDACRTHECKTALRAVLERADLIDQYRFEMSCIPLTLRMMWRGLAVAHDEMKAQHAAILTEKYETGIWLDIATGCDFNPESTPQMRALFYNDLALPTRLDKHTRQPSLKDHDLTQITRQWPLTRPLIEKIQLFRTLDTIKDSVDPACLSPDGRLRTALNPAYVETFRFSSNETAFGEGHNLQNIARPPED